MSDQLSVNGNGGGNVATIIAAVVAAVNATNGNGGGNVDAAEVAAAVAAALPNGNGGNGGGLLLDSADCRDSEGRWILRRYGGTITLPESTGNKLNEVSALSVGERSSVLTVNRRKALTNILKANGFKYGGGGFADGTVTWERERDGATLVYHYRKHNKSAAAQGSVNVERVA